MPLYALIWFKLNSFSLTAAVGSGGRADGCACAAGGPPCCPWRRSKGDGTVGLHEYVKAIRYDDYHS